MNDFMDRYHYWLPHINRVTLDEDQRAWLLSMLCFKLPAFITRVKERGTYFFRRTKLLLQLTPVYLMVSSFCCDTGRFYRCCRYEWRGWRWPGLRAYRDTTYESLHYMGDGPSSYWRVNKQDYEDWWLLEQGKAPPTKRGPDPYAALLNRIGVPPNGSSGICGGTTYGYGKLDNNGYWQHMLRIEYD